jgi:hypothetical protein
VIVQELPPTNDTATPDEALFKKSESAKDLVRGIDLAIERVAGADATAPSTVNLTMKAFIKSTDFMILDIDKIPLAFYPDKNIPGLSQVTASPAQADVTTKPDTTGLGVRAWCHDSADCKVVRVKIEWHNDDGTMKTYAIFEKTEKDDGSFELTNNNTDENAAVLTFDAAKAIFDAEVAKQTGDAGTCDKVPCPVPPGAATPPATGGAGTGAQTPTPGAQPPATTVPPGGVAGGTTAPPTAPTAPTQPQAVAPFSSAGSQKRMEEMGGGRPAAAPSTQVPAAGNPGATAPATNTPAAPAPAAQTAAPFTSVGSQRRTNQMGGSATPIAVAPSAARTGQNPTMAQLPAGSPVATARNVPTSAVPFTTRPVVAPSAGAQRRADEMGGPVSKTPAAAAPVAAQKVTPFASAGSHRRSDEMGGPAPRSAAPATTAAPAASAAAPASGAKAPANSADAANKAMQNSGKP